jgi:hypothetical protein
MLYLFLLEYLQQCIHISKFLIAKLIEIRNNIISEIKLKPQWNNVNSRTLVRCLEAILLAFDSSLNPESSTPETDRIDDNIDDK